MSYDREPTQKELAEAQLRRLSKAVLRQYSRFPILEGSIDEYEIRELELSKRYRPDSIRIARFKDGGVLSFVGSDYDISSSIAYQHTFAARPVSDPEDFDVRYSRRTLDLEGGVEPPAYDNVNATTLTDVPLFNDALTQAVRIADGIEIGIQRPPTDANIRDFNDVRKDP